MAWSVIRKATDDDVNKLRASAGRFLERHFEVDVIMGLPFDPILEVESQLSYLKSDHDPNFTRLNRLWLRVVRRALDNPQTEGIAYGYVGYSAD